MQYLTIIVIISASMTFGVFVGAQLRTWQVRTAHRRLEQDRQNHIIAMAKAKTESYKLGFEFGRKCAVGVMTYAGDQ